MIDRDLSDEQLLAAFAKGERAALGELARRYERALLGLASGVLGGRRDAGGAEGLAMDAVQETWLRVIRFARHFKGSSSVKTWLYRITINQCRTLQANAAREARRRRESNADGTGARETSSVADDPHVEPRAALQEGWMNASDDEQVRRMREAVARLDINRRTLVLLCYHASMKHQQAAEILGLPLGTLKSRLHATLKQLRELLPEEVRT